MTYTFPDGSLPYGYHVKGGYPIENDTEDGMEVSIVYVGPSEDRWLFLEEIFGRWETGANTVQAGPEQELHCYATLVTPPRKYVLNSGRQEEVEIEGQPVTRDVLYDHLWPDTFTIRPVDDPSPIKGESADEGELELLERSISYECVCEITVNYRSKCHAGWPTWCYSACVRTGFQPMDTDQGPQGCFALPPGQTGLWKQLPMATGTFLEVGKESKVEFQSIPGRWLQFDTSEGGWETGARQEVPHDVSGMVSIVSTNLEVIWSNVPLVPLDGIIACRGKLNDKPFLGFPAESVLFLGEQVKAKKPFYHRWETDDITKSVEIYTITYRFVAQTVDAIQGYPSPKNCFGQMGYFNRRWCEFPVPGGDPISTSIFPYLPNTTYPAGAYVTYGGFVYVSTDIIPPNTPPPGGDWNVYSTPIDSPFRLIKHISTGKKPYSSANFNALFDIDVIEV